MHTAKPVVQLATAPGCPYCPTMKRQLQQLQARGLLSDLQIIDISHAPDFANQNRIRSVPWIKIGELVFTGSQSLPELEHWITRAGDDDGIREYIIRELETGRLSAVDELLHNHPQWLSIATNIIADMDAPMQARIGVSALIESEQDPALLQVMEPMLIAFTRHADPRVRGDACHLLSVINTDASKQALQACLQDDDAQVRDIATESLAGLA